MTARPVPGEVFHSSTAYSLFVGPHSPPLAPCGLAGVAGASEGPGYDEGEREQRSEEMMLRDTFGKEWEVWHAKTKRFIPGIF